MKRINLLLAMILILTSQSIFAQSKIENAKQYLEKQIRDNVEVIVDKSKQQVLNSNVLAVSKTINLGDPYNNTDIANLYLIQNKSKLKSFSRMAELIQSKEFIDAVNPKFRLKTKEDVAKFAWVIMTLRRYESGSFGRLEVFKKDDKWCVVTRSWFGDVSYYKLETESGGKISGIKHFKEKMEISKIDVPQIREDYSGKSESISSADKKLLYKELQKVVEGYKFNLTAFSIYGVPKELSFFDGSLEISETYEDGVKGTSESPFILISKGAEYYVIRSKDELLENKEFAQALSKKYKIKNEADAKKFEAVLDSIKPAEKEIKKFYKKDNVWCFVREKFFEDERGFLVLTDKSGKILYMENVHKISDTEILKMKMHNPNFKIDYKFKLEEPAKNKLTIKAKQKIPVKISFDANMVNAKNAYIASFSDGKMSGFSAGSSMESPYTNDILGMDYDNGNHTKTYMLLPSGSADPKDALASVKFELTVTESVTKQERQSVNMLINNVLEAIKVKDVEKLKSYFITKNQFDNMLAGVKGSSEDEKIFKEEMKNVNLKEYSTKSVESFKKLQELLSKSKVDNSKIKFYSNEGELRNIVLPSVKHLKTIFAFDAGNNSLGAVQCEVLVNDKGAYLLGYKSFNEDLIGMKDYKKSKAMGFGLAMLFMKR